MSDAYKKAGVNLAAGYESVERIKKHVASTNRLGVMGFFGEFGGTFDLSSLNYKKPVLVSGTDGVGTKLKLAFIMGIHNTIGIDAVAMCVNDILTQGAEPLYFLDYLACGENIPTQIEAIVEGVAVGCKQSKMALLGGETAEMPGFYRKGEYDIAGFAVGVVEKDKLIDKNRTQAGDVIIGLPATGVHSNGFSLVRHIIKDNGFDYHQTYQGFTQPLGEVLLTPTAIYVEEILTLLKEVDIHTMAHITGGGFYENVPRMLPDGLSATFDHTSWERPPIFSFLKEAGHLKEKEMFNIFNMGIGFMIVVAEEEAEKALTFLPHGRIIGEVTLNQAPDKVLDLGF